MYYPSSENNGADQLRGYREADLRLCFRIGKNPVFSRCGSIINCAQVCMDKMLLLLTVIIAVYPNLHAPLVRADGNLSKPLVSKQAATDGCLKQGTTLISNKDINDYGSGTEYLNQLNDGESAWIEGYATLSPFQVLMGCFNTTDWRVPSTVRKEVAMDNPNVYECVTECRGLRFVGIENTSCYCIPEHDINGRDFLQRGVNNSACSISCDDEMNSCGGYLYMNIGIKHDFPFINIR